MGKERIFYCYSKHLCWFLKLNGFEYTKKIQHKNGTYYYIFPGTAALNATLTKWNEYKKLFPLKS